MTPAEPAKLPTEVSSPLEAAPGQIKGTQPWLPWPFSAWPWWTQPVRAERVAAMRIALAAFLLVDLLTFYLPSLSDIYGPGSLGSPDFFDYYAAAPRSYWSILRGFGDSLVSALALIFWLGSTILLVLRGWGLLSVGPDPKSVSSRSSPVAAILWCFSGWTLVLGIWSRVHANANGDIAWLAPLGMLAVGGLLLTAEGWVHRRVTARPVGLGHVVWLAVGCLGLALFAGIAWLVPPGSWDGELAHRLLGPWHNDGEMPTVFFWGWVAAAFFLLIGLWTRTAAVATWAFTLSFSHVNPNIESAGDVIRTIVLFYLVLLPCGAVWSVDRWLEVRRRGRVAGLVSVPPWPLRLMFVQMVLIYFMNGIYKEPGEDWRSGESLHYVLCDLTLSRVSFEMLRIPFWMTQALTWSVLVWEIGFPLWVALRWTRALALWFGVAFHLGIWVTMELGGFVPYMMCMYLPLLAWEKVAGRFRRSA